MIKAELKTNPLQPEGQGESLEVYVTHLDDLEPYPEILWSLDDSFRDNEEPRWSEGRLEIKAHEKEDAKFKIELLAKKGNNDKSFVAVDSFEFKNTGWCEFEPKEAVPTTTSSTTTTPTIPTEPPKRNFHLFSE